MALSLEGTKILDLSRVLAGPLCSMMLGDAGACVIKVERPGVGDETRGWGPPFHPNGASAYFLAVNRNKLSIALDLDSAADREVLRGLISSADVVLENFLPGTLERRGIAPAACLASAPDLIWCTISGFGPGSVRPGYDFVTQAESGWMAITGDPAGDPMKAGVALADVIAGKDAAIAILGTLLARASADTPLPLSSRHLHVSLLQSAQAALVNVAQNVLVSGADAPRWGNAHPNLVPYQLFRAADRHLVIAVGSDAQWRAMCSVLLLDALAADSALDTNAGRLAQRARVTDAIAERVAERPAEEWLGALAAMGVPCGEVRTVAEALAGVPASAETGVPPAVPGTVRRPPPSLDEHGPVIRQLGWGAFAELRP